ncbi:hypothetical protein TESG_07299 [Trichophyton tonsurans CBS 112818]|uniref:Uncharacterized protein n=1 Tax=Trichophyton tonsurans (strain CBS 112818) TaxID=647933 RepID=F2S8S2_TRIT1|nr:hypothetical protein TESG_07299 [Trichophyton tonsurans CBS 112818]
MAVTAGPANSWTARDTESQELEAAKAQRANIFGAKLIIEGLWLYGWDYKELSECRGQIMMALFKHIDKSELARGKVKARREGIDHHSVSGEISPSPWEPDRANGANEESIFNLLRDAPGPPNNNVTQGIVVSPSDREATMGGGSRAPGSDSDNNIETPRSPLSPSAEGYPSDYSSHPRGDSTDSSEKTPSSTPCPDNSQRLGFLAEVAEAHGQYSKKRPYPADNGCCRPVAQQRRLNREAEGNGSEKVVTESRQQLFPGTQLSQPDNNARRSPAANNTLSPNIPLTPTGELYDANQNFGINPSALDKYASDQSPRRTIIPTTNTNIDARQNDPFFGADTNSPNFDINNRNTEPPCNFNSDDIPFYEFDNDNGWGFDQDEVPLCDFDVDQ